MALENVFGSPPPVVGLLLNHTMNKHGEKQRNGFSDDHSDGEKEEGEIEDGEIIDSQEDEENGGLPTPGAFGAKIPRHDHVQMNLNWGTVQVTNDGNVTSSKKSKKKKKKKKKRPLGQLLEEELGTGAAAVALASTEDANTPKAKKQRKFYVDHDRVNDEDPFYRSTSPPFQRGPRGMDSYMNSTSPPPGYDSPSYRSSPPQPLPPTRRSRSPPGLYDSPYESDENYDGPGCPPPFSDTNGRYDNGTMGLGGGGEPLDSSGRMMGNGPGKNRRKGRRGGDNGRQGGGRKKRKQRPPVALCKFYQDGKCSKGDECTFKHDGSVPKKLELCKFYLNGFCAKSEQCIYLHSEYPCKFFHTGVKCYSADKCRFSHEPLTDETRLLLEKCLDKEEDEMMEEAHQKHFRPSLLGTPPNRGGGSAHEALKGIPSLFDIEVSIPPSLQQQHLQQQQQQQNMSPPMDEEDHNQMGPNVPFYAETMNNGSPPRIPTKTPLLPLPFGVNRSQRGGGHNYDDDDGEHDMYRPMGMMMDVDDRIGGMDCAPYVSNGESMDTDLRTMLPQNCSGDGERNMFNSRPWHITAVDVDMRGRRMDSNDGDDWDTKKEYQSDHEKGRSSDSESEGAAKKTDSTGPIQVPFHLPKKQRELFLRIQQQQRAAASSSQKNADKDAKRRVDGDEGGEEEMKEEMDNGEEDDENLSDLKVERREEEEDERDFDRREEEEQQEEEEEEELGEDEENEYEAFGGSETKAEREVEMDEQQEKEKWYSSDDDDEDEDQPLTAVLKKLQQQPIQKVEPPKPIQQPTTTTNPFSTTSIFDIAKMIQSITNQSSHSGTSTNNTVNGNANAVKKTIEKSTADSRSRDPRSLKSASGGGGSGGTESRDPRAARSIETHEHIHKSFFRDPRMLQRERTSINKDLKSSSALLNVKRDPKGSLLSSPDRTDGSNPNSITYRVHTAVVSRPDYAQIAITSNMDPRQVMSDPRLKRHVADDPRFSLYAVSSPHSSSDEGADHHKKKAKETSVRNITSSKVKIGGTKNVTNARPGLHRLGAVTMPGPLRDESLSKGSGSSSLDGRKGEEEDYSMYDLDDIVKKPSAFPRRLSRDASIELIRSPAREGVTKEPIGKRPLSKVEEYDILREEGGGTPPLSELKVPEPAKIKGGSCNRKSSMDYASPLGGYDSGDRTETGYRKRPHSAVVSRNKPIEPSVTIPKDLLEPPRSSPPPIGITSLPTPMDSSGSSTDEVLVIDSLKDIFKTIDPTASPFC